jgi:AcrR family transcriptional regulator
MARRGPYAKTAETREQALTAALGIIHERGLSSTSIQQIADAVGLTKAGLLHHFGSRDGLLIAVIERSDQLNGEAFADGPSLDALIEVDRRNMEVPGLVGLYLALVAAAAADRGDTPARRHFAERYAGFRTSMVDYVRAGQADGSIRDDVDAALLASLITAVSDGLQMQWLLDEDVPGMPAFAAFKTLLAPPA